VAKDKSKFIYLFFRLYFQTFASLSYSEISIPLQADQVSKTNLFSKQGDVNFGGRGYYQ
jgi:hypothetical protein